MAVYGRMPIITTVKSRMMELRGFQISGIIDHVIRLVRELFADAFESRPSQNRTSGFPNIRLFNLSLNRSQL